MLLESVFERRKKVLSQNENHADEKAARIFSIQILDKQKAFDDNKIDFDICKTFERNRKTKQNKTIGRNVGEKKNP